MDPVEWATEIAKRRLKSQMSVRTEVVIAGCTVVWHFADSIGPIQLPRSPSSTGRARGWAQHNVRSTMNP